MMTGLGDSFKIACDIVCTFQPLVSMRIHEGPKIRNDGTCTSITLSIRPIPFLKNIVGIAVAFFERIFH